MSEFLSKNETNSYFESKNKKFAEAMKLCRHRTLEKVFPGKKMVMFERLRENVFKVHGLFAVNVIGMDREGVYIVLRDLLSEETFRVSHVPVPMTRAGRSVYVSVPSHTNLERTCRMEEGWVKESIACLLMVKMANSVMNGVLGDMYLTDMKFFLDRAGEAEGAKLLNAFQFKGSQT